MPKKLRDLDSLPSIQGKRVVVRVDFNVPFKGKKIISDFKIQQSLSTIRYLQKKGARIILISHLGRPKNYQSALSLKPVAKYLEKLLKTKIVFLDIHTLRKSWKTVILKTKQLPLNKILFLENIRFFKEEEKNTIVFSKKLAKLGDIFVLDGFGVVHRSGASITGISDYLPTYAGNLLKKEIKSLDQLLEKPKHPLVVILGGVKLETKLPLIKKFLPLADNILLGGGLANTYLWAKGNKIGNSYVEENYKQKMIDLFRYKKIIVPQDVGLGTIKGKKVRYVQVQKIDLQDKDMGIYDIGPKTIKKYIEIIKKARTIVWNGAVGFFEQTPYQKGTFTLAQVLGKQALKKTFIVCGGGETEQILRSLKLQDKIDLISTGGGAMLEYLSGKKLPGLQHIFY